MTILDASKTCFFHPTKFIFLDDNRAFLDALELEFSGQIAMQTFTDPDVALHAINEQSTDLTQSTLNVINDLNVDTTTDRLVGYEINNILRNIYDKTRFDNVGVVIADYEMPDLNGVEFCKKLGDKNIFKIMLTAEADKDIAINAFNTGAIDKFILKTSAHLHQEIRSAIHELTQRYFKELSRPIIDSYSYDVKCLFDNALYQQLFNRVALESQAVEYYMVDNFGSFLFLDKNANPTWLLIQHTKELREQLDLLQGYELPSSVLSAIAGREKILFLLSEEEYKKPVDEWVNYTFPSEQLDDEYHFSIVKGHLTESIQWDAIVPYASYKN